MAIPRTRFTIGAFCVDWGERCQENFSASGAERHRGKDDAKDALLVDEAGKSEFWKALGDECAKSSLIGLLEGL